jgi:hypothetical protein
MIATKKIIGFIVTGGFGVLAFLSNTGCNYKFRDIGSIPDSIRTVKVNMIENRASYVNPQLSPLLTDKLQQKIVSQTRLSQTNNDNADWEITGYVSNYSLSTSAISGQREATNRLTVMVHIFSHPIPSAGRSFPANGNDTSPNRRNL